MTRFYSKELPKTPIYLPNGDKITFETAGGLLGYYSTDNESAQKALADLERQHRGGVTQITQEEFERDFGKKKAALTPSGRDFRWREELGGGAAPDTLFKRQSPQDGSAGAAGAVAAVAKPTPPTEPPPAAEKRPVRPPNVGRRPS